MAKRRVGILGGTGIVGQKYMSLLENHPWFDVTYLTASPRSTGKTYQEAVEGRWFIDRPVPPRIKHLVVKDVSDFEAAEDQCDFLFSAFEINNKDEIRQIENHYAKMGFPVVSNASAHRWTDDVPILIPEINAHHTDLIDIQKKNNQWGDGFVVVKPNCSIQSFMFPLDALIKGGYEPQEIIITTLQAVSGAGVPGVSSMEILDNIVPYIDGEEAKTEKEPLKIFGTIEGDKIALNNTLKISGTCTRVPVIDGHTAVVNVRFKGRVPSIETIKSLFKNYRSVPQELELPSAPKNPIHLMEENDRPQPQKDRNTENGMAVSVGRVEQCDVFDIRFIGLSHNTIRGAAGGGILNAELLVAKGLIRAK